MPSTTRPMEGPSLHPTLLRFFAFSFVLLGCLPTAYGTEWIQYPVDGYATMTHYELPPDFIAACGCNTASTDFPTAAMSQMAYGSSTSYGISCGRCFNLTLLNTFTSNPPFYPNVSKSVVIKVTDLCPLSSNGWCDATPTKTNAGGHYLNFDLAWPSTSIPDDFFPSDEALYGFTDFGVWNISYQSVSCQAWQGWNNASALGSVADLGYPACCPNNPTPATPNNTCPSFSDENGIAPEHEANLAFSVAIPQIYILWVLGISLSLFYLL
ncbi:RlpA-like double-psi beta-barrel-protein domain-containing protein-containing protein [Hygrophoropsis aurantiaca]|uniref:RlpA-like double-psi beta-barrel-protein domain-containing protein-containing protein n=1 Tax=Hygrophoropsis aurantiaca TaxID=72124 RepID=A0ACB8AJE1_9AGAM|nr:RlpA-like double-psi beta-barrel-protein domain-containing protein-containing protein [Hygrophoropsis aurantiaca]